MSASDRVEWTVTADEQAALIRASTWQLWRKLALSVVTLLAGGLALLGATRWGAPGLLLGPVLAGAMAAWLWFAAHRSVRRLLVAAYPVGATVAAEATPERLRLATEAGASELPWERLTEARVGPVVVLVKDAVCRQWVTIPRPLFHDAWRPYLPR